MDTSPPHKLIVPTLETPLRLDKFLIQEFPFTSRSFWRNHLVNLVKINGKKVNKGLVLSGGECLSILKLPSPDQAPLQANPDIKIEVLFEDSCFIAINKNPGIPCLPRQANETNTIINGLLARYPEQANVDPVSWEAGLLHRLDNETSGILLFAKSSEIKTLFFKLQKQGKVLKSYLAWVHGTPSKEGSLQWPIAHHPKNQKKMLCITDPLVSLAKKARPAQTDYELLKQHGEFSLLQIIIASGLRHQIRVHLAQLGNPIVGDQLYGSAPITQYKHQLLHADKINFRHPQTLKKIQLTAPTPKDFNP